ncbi:MAG TPA: hypothetical protein VK524_17990 [Polyangiaceae bacterium]|nr:hypothetical protein [Polyangiaceae bacterium]
MNARSLTCFMVFAVCSACKEPKPPLPAEIEAAAALSPVMDPTTALLPAPKFTAKDSARGYALPGGCKLALPIQETELPENAEFTAADGALDELAIATPAPEHRTRVRTRGWIDFSQGSTRDLPWMDLGAPPALARTRDFWLAAQVERDQAGADRARLWQQGKAGGTFASGDRLAAADAICNGKRCAVLTTLARLNLAPGATVFAGSADQPASSWQRVDIEARADEAFRPFSILELAPDTVRGSLALVSPASVAIWDFTERGAKERAQEVAPFGVFDIVNGAEPLLVMPGARPDGPCAEDRFPLRFAAFGNPGSSIDVQTPPRSLAARKVPGGALVVWVAPVSCRNKQRKIVYAVLVRPDGGVIGTPMSVADASGFALATKDDRVSLWLRTERGLTWLKARCSAEGSDAADPARRAQDAAR